MGGTIKIIITMLTFFSPAITFKRNDVLNPFSSGKSQSIVFNKLNFIITHFDTKITPVFLSFQQIYHIAGPTIYHLCIIIIIYIHIDRRINFIYYNIKSECKYLYGIYLSMIDI